MYRTSMPKKELVAASSRPLVLSILAEGENYGYSIIQRVRELSGGALEWTDGMLYPVLHRLEKEGLIIAEWKTPATGRRRKYYRLRPEGESALERSGPSGRLSMQPYNVCGTLGRVCPRLPAQFNYPLPSHLNRIMNSFETERAITQWRSEMAALEGMNADSIEELETHLRESFDSLSQSNAGLSADEAFHIAKRRLGDPKELDQEFASISPSVIWRRRVFWALIGFIDITLLLVAISIIGRLGLWGATALEAPGSLALWTTISFGIAALIIALMVALSWRFILIANPHTVVDQFARYPIFCSAIILIFVGIVKAGSLVVDVLVTQTVSLEQFGDIAFHARTASMTTTAIIFFSVCLTLGVLSRSSFGHSLGKSGSNT